MVLSDNEMTVDPEGVVDTPKNSIFAGAAILFGILGLFTIVAPFFSIFCAVSVVSALIVLLFAKSWYLSRLSTWAATICVLVGLFCGLAGVCYRMTRERIIDDKAMEVATQYMHALSISDLATAIQMSGLPPMVKDSDLEGTKLSREQQGVRDFIADPAIQEVITHGKDAPWKTTGLKGKYREGLVFFLSFGFVDESATNPRPIVVTVKMIPPIPEAAEKRNQWLVQAVDLAPL